MHDKQIFVILGHFLPFNFPNNLKNQNFEKMKKTHEDIIILHLHTTNDDHDVWFLRYGPRQTEFFVTLDYFLPFYHPNNPENQNFEKMKKYACRYCHFTHVYHK